MRLHPQRPTSFLRGNGVGQHNTENKYILKAQVLVARNYSPPPFNFLLTYLFSIKFLYFFIISFLFPYFNLFVSIFIQSYVNRNLHVSTQYILIIHKARNSETVNIVHLLASVTFSSPYSHYIIQTRTCINS